MAELKLFVDANSEISDKVIICQSNADKLGIKNGDSVGAIKKYKTAAIILENTEHYSELAKILIKLILLCAENQYYENSEEELRLFEKIKDKISIADFDEDLKKINTILQNK